MRQPRRLPRPPRLLCCPWGGFPASSSGAARCGARLRWPCRRPGIRSSLWAAQRVLCARSPGPTLTSEGFCVRSEGRPGGGVSFARCPQRPSSPFQPPAALPAQGSGHAGCDRGCPRECGALHPTYSNSPPSRWVQGDQLGGLASWGAAVLTSHGSAPVRAVAEGSLLDTRKHSSCHHPLFTSAREPCCAFQALPRQLRTGLAVQDVQGSVLEAVPAHGSGVGTR